LIREDLIPEQAANRLKLEGELQISHEAIYRHVYADKWEGGNPCRHLRMPKTKLQEGKSDEV